MDWTLEKQDLEFINAVQEEVNKSIEELDRYTLHPVFGRLATIWALANRLVAEREPWKLKGVNTEKNKLIYLCLEAIRLMAIFLKPVIPRAIQPLDHYLDIEANLSDRRGTTFRVVDSSSYVASTSLNFHGRSNQDFFLKFDKNKRAGFALQKIQ